MEAAFPIDANRSPDDSDHFLLIKVAEKEIDVWEVLSREINNKNLCFIGFVGLISEVDHTQLLCEQTSCQLLTPDPRSKPSQEFHNSPGNR